MKLGNRLFWLVLAAVAMLGWAGCGSGCPTSSLSSSGSGGGGSTGGTSTGGTVCGPGTNPGGGGNNASLLYYLDSSNSRILGAGLSTTGAFTALTPFTPPTLPSGAGNDMAIVNKKFLYLPQSDTLTIQAFTIDHTSGALTAVSGSPFATAGADSITSDPAGRFLFVGNQTTGSVSVFQINATTGALVAAPGSPFFAFNLDFARGAGGGWHGEIPLRRSGLCGPAGLCLFHRSEQRRAFPGAGSPFGLGVAGVRTDFTGKFAVGLSGVFGDNHLYVFAIDPTSGALTPVNNSPFATTMATPENLRIHPSSQFVYGFGVDNSSFAATEGFTIDPSSGALTALAARRSPPCPLWEIASGTRAAGKHSAPTRPAARFRCWTPVLPPAP